MKFRLLSIILVIASVRIQKGGSCTTVNDGCYAIYVCASSECSQCTTNSQCSSQHTIRTTCSSESAGIFCVQCSSDSQCGSGESCITSSDTYMCGSTCTSPTSNCGPSSQCIYIGSQFYCIACENNVDCQNWSGNSASHCSSGVCSPAFLSCGQDSDCTNPNSAYCSNSVCTACSSSSHCNHLTGIQICNSGTCVQCTSDSNCTDPTPYCSASNTCVQCNSDSECAAPTSYCSGSNTCVECTASSQCTHLTSTPVCTSTSGGTCVQCVSDPDCPLAAAAHCSGSNTCVACTLSTHCAHLTSTPVCKNSSGAGLCVECLSSSDCKDPSRSQCLPTTNTCSIACINYCLQCFNTTACETCFSGYYLLDTTACLTTCPSGYWRNNQTQTCDLCNSICQTCSVNANRCASCFTPYILDGSTCRTPPHKSPPIATLQSSSDPETFLLVFSNPMAVTPAILIQTLQFSLTNMNPTTDYYLLNITEQPDSKTFNLIFNFTKSVGIENLTVIFANQKAISDKNGLIITQDSVSTQTIRFTFFTNEEKTVAQAITNAASITTNVALGSSVGMAIIGGSGGLLWAFVGLFQIVNYLIYLNVNYPYNVVTFFSIFNTANINIIPNPIQFFFPSLYNEMQAGQLPSPPKFWNNSMDAMYLNNAGQTLTGWVIMGTLYILTKIILFVFRTSGTFNKIITKFKEAFEWGLVYNAFIGTYPDLIIASCLQFTNMNFTNAMYIFSSTAALIIGACCFYAPFVVTYALESSVEVLGTEIHSQKHGALYETFIVHSDNRKSPEKAYYRRNFMAFIFLRKMAYFSGIVLAYYIPILQMVITCCSGLVLLIFMIIFTPFRNKRDAWMNIGSEVFMLVIHAAIFVFAGDDITMKLTDTQIKNVGWILIGLCCLLVAYNAYFIFVQQMIGFWTAFKLIKRVICKKKQNANEKSVNESENHIITKNSLGNQEGPKKSLGTKGVRPKFRSRNNFMQAENAARNSNSARETSKLEVKPIKKIGVLKTSS